MPVSPRNKILITASFATLVVIALFSWGIYQIRSQEIHKIELQMQNKAWNYASQLDAYLHDLGRVATATAIYAQVHPKVTEKQIYKQLRANLEQSPNIFGAAMAFEPSQYRRKALFAPYVYRSKTGIQQMDIGGSDGYDYTDKEWQWWHTPRNSGKATWSPAYFDKGAGNILMTSYSAPFKRHGKFWGVTTVDIELTHLKSVLSDTNKKMPLFMLLDQEGHYIYHPKPEKIMQSTLFDNAKKTNKAELKSVWQRLKSSQAGVLKTDSWGDSGAMLWVMHAPIAATGWVFTSWVTEEQALAGSSTYLWGITSFLLSAMLFVIIGLIYITQLALKALVTKNQQSLDTADKTQPKKLADPISITIILSLLLFLLFTLAWFFLVEQKTVNHLTIAAGHRDSESYALAQAIAQVTPKYHPDIKIQVLETDGSKQNVALLEKNLVQLATVLADTDMPPAATLMANLYPDAFQLIVQADSAIHSVADLKGHRIALPTKDSSQYNTFWSLADHYGLTQADLEYRSMSNGAASFALLDKAIDALFWVSAPGSSAILDLIEAGNLRLIPINQAEALQLDQPALQIGVIPVGSYRGNPAVPAEDLATAMVPRLLVTHEKLDPELVSRITSVLFERRRELVNVIPLAGFITAPDKNNVFLPIHEGAQNFYDRDEPSFVEEYVDIIALILSVIAVIFSSVLHLLSDKKKQLVDAYNRELLDLCDTARKSFNYQQLFDIKDKLLDMLSELVLAEAEGEITTEAFESFAFTWKAVNESVRDRLLLDLEHHHHKPQPSEEQQDAD
ncbi:MAG: TAXI family TRAP transporter solute-binding subunit [Methyloprofundus sp.]|nr:TAXI family TRAP transporter solute-binding subunit [Methyloprofundus sp.]